MKSNNKKIIPIAFLVILSVGCSKSFLEVSPPSQIEETNFFQTEIQANQALAAIYRVSQWGNINHGHSPIMGFEEAASDDAYSGGGSSSDAVGVKGIDNFQATDGAPFNQNDITYESIWNILYQGVARSNTYLANIGRVAASDDFKNETSAEVKFLRASYYFELVKWYENIPLVTEPLLDPNKYNQPQSAPQDVYNQIAKDLVEAMIYLPKTSMKTSNGHATYYSAEALLARVYLFCKGVYGKDLQAGSVVIDAAKTRTNLDEIITSGIFNLFPNYSDIWRKQNEMGMESVWEVDCSSLALKVGSTSNQYQAQGNYNVLYFGPRGVNGDPYTAGFSNAVPTESLYEEFETSPITDPRRDATILTLNSQSVAPGLIKGWQHTGYFNNKYNTSTEYLTPSGLNSINWGQNIHTIRFSDVLLMASELNMGVDQGKADLYLNRVRERAGLADRTATVENLRHERRVELGGEGIRYWDLLRYGLDYTKQMIDASSLVGPLYNGGGTFTKGANTPPSGYKMNWDPSKKGHLPIPPSQVILSDGVLQQNPGYQ
ncbi:MAG: RagB/SusD family nutrient uptake outer membrane protein [Ginsengibacter sp.]